MTVRARSSRSPQPRRLAGFTLIEVLAAVFLTAIVMTVAITFFVQLSDSTDAAEAKARDGRLALAVLDRVARDLEGSYLLVKPADLDPLLDPWIFLAENDEGDSESDRIKFVTRSNKPKSRYDHSSDLAVVTYLLHKADDGAGFELLRSVSPGLPDQLDHDFPPADDESYMLVADRIQSFGVRFLDADDEWVDEWDSSQIEQADQLPKAAEVEISFLPPADQAPAPAADTASLGATDDDRSLFVRRVNLPMQPIDLAGMLAEVTEQAAKDAQEAQQNGTAGQNGQNGTSGKGGSSSKNVPGIDKSILENLPPGVDLKDFEGMPGFPQ